MILIDTLASAKTETLTGIAAITTTGLMNFIHDLFPIVSAVSVCAGCFLAIHGVVRIICLWSKGKSSFVDYDNDRNY